VAAFITAALRLYEKLGYTTVWHRLRYQIPERSPADGSEPKAKSQ
jgi:hypothetical protein